MPSPGMMGPKMSLSTPLITVTRIIHAGRTSTVYEGLLREGVGGACRPVAIKRHSDAKRCQREFTALLHMLDAVDHGKLLRLEYQRTLDDAEVDLSALSEADVLGVRARAAARAGERSARGAAAPLSPHPLNLVTALVPGVGGPVLAGRRHREPSDREVADEVRGAFEAIEELHRATKVAHLDCKPDNFVRGAGGADRPTVLVDFDLAAVLPRDGGWARGRRGTPLTMPPETWRNGHMSRASDVWATGIMLFGAAHPGTSHPYDLVRPAPREMTLPEFRDCMLLNDYEEEGMWSNSRAPLARELCAMLLRDRPSERPDATEALRHPLFRR